MQGFFFFQVFKYSIGICRKIFTSEVQNQTRIKETDDIQGDKKVATTLTVMGIRHWLVNSFSFQSFIYLFMTCHHKISGTFSCCNVTAAFYFTKIQTSVYLILPSSAMCCLEQLTTLLCFKLEEISLLQRSSRKLILTFWLLIKKRQYISVLILPAV